MKYYLRFLRIGKMNYYMIVVSNLFVYIESKSLRSVGGRNASEGEFPFILSLEDFFDNTWLFFCSGSALTPIWALTAEHCFKEISDIKKEKIRSRVRYNSLIAGAMGETSDITSVVKHARNDIALIKTKPINVRGFAKLSPLDYTSLYGKRGFVIGYGSTNVTYNYGEQNLETLQVVEGMLAKCESYRQYSDAALCLLPRCNNVAVSLQGDSGGPVIHSSGVVGVCVESADHYDEPRHHLSTASIKLETVVCATEAVSIFLDWIRDVVAT